MPSVSKHIVKEFDVLSLLWSVSKLQEADAVFFFFFMIISPPIFFFGGDTEFLTGPNIDLAKLDDQ